MKHWTRRDLATWLALESVVALAAIGWVTLWAPVAPIYFICASWALYRAKWWRSC